MVPPDTAKSLKEIQFPSTINKIGNYAFSCALGLESIELPTTIMNIGDYAFQCCNSIKVLYLPASIKFIGAGAFSSCASLQSVTMDADISGQLSAGIFSGCANLTDAVINSPNLKKTNKTFTHCSKLKNIKLPKSLEELDDQAFYYCTSLEVINLPRTIIDFNSWNWNSNANSWIFYCPSLREVNIEDGNAKYTSINGVVYNHNISELIYLPPSNSKIYEVPTSVVKIGDFAFVGNRKLKHVYAAMPDIQIDENAIVLNCNIKKIGEYAFRYCSELEDVCLPNSVVTLDNGIFWGCDALKNLQLSEGLTSIGELCLHADQLENLILPPLLTKIPHIFYGKNRVKHTYAPYIEPIECEIKEQQEVLYVPAGSKSRYAATPGWENFLEIKEIEYTKASSIKIDQQEYFTEINAPIKLSGSLEPENTFFKHIQWECVDNSQDVSIGKNNGIFVGKTKGVYTVTAYPVYGSDISDECKVYVGYSKPQSALFDRDIISLHPGETMVASLNIYPENAYYKQIVWSTDDETIAVVDNNGIVNSKNIGVTKLRAQIVDTDIYAECEINVTAIPIERIIIPISKWQGTKNETFQLSANIFPENATNKAIIWSTSDESIASVDNTGFVTSVGCGECIITASAADGSGISATCAVTVSPILVESLSLAPSKWSAVEGESFQIKAIIMPENAENEIIEWSSNDINVATVNNNGLVSVIKEGCCIITAKTTDGSNLFAECIVTSTSDIDDIFADPDDRFDIYNLQGLLIKSNSNRKDLKELSPGIYIIRRDSDSRKIIIR